MSATETQTTTDPEPTSDIVTTSPQDDSSSSTEGRKPLSGGTIALGWVAAAFANAITFTPLIAAWLRSTGTRYVEGLTSGTLLPVDYLDLSTWALSLMGLEIIIRSTNFVVLLMLIGVAAGILLGLIGIPLAAALKWAFRVFVKDFAFSSRASKVILSYGIVAWGSLVILTFFYSIYAAVFVTPDRAVCVGETRFEAIRKNVASTCEICGKFGKDIEPRYPLISGKDRTLLMGKTGSIIVENSALSPASSVSSKGFSTVIKQPMSIKDAVIMCAADKNPLA